MSKYTNKYNLPSSISRDKDSVIDEDMSCLTSIATVIDTISNGQENVGSIIISVKKIDGTYSNKIAYPMSSHSFTLPLPNERVSVFKDGLSGNWYYFTAIGRLGYTNHMANGFKKVYKKGTRELHAGKTFVPNPSRKSINVYEGDTILQGRNGQSIRLGSTVPDSNTEWVSNEVEQNPIITIRNGFSTIENNDTDFSSIYLTSGQQLPIKLNNRVPSDFTKVTEYSNSQIVLKSDRVLLTSRENDILLASNTNIGLVTSKWALDVNEFVDQMLELCDQVISMGQQLQKQGLASSLSTHVSAAPGSPTTPPVNVADFQLVSNNSINITNKCQQIKNKLSIMKQ